MLWWTTLGMRPSTPEERSVAGCLIFFLLIAAGLLGLGFLVFCRFRGRPHPEEGSILASSLVCLGVAAAIPIGKRIAERLYGE